MEEEVGFIEENYPAFEKIGVVLLEMMTYIDEVTPNQPLSITFTSSSVR